MEGWAGTPYGSEIRAGGPGVRGFAARAQRQQEPAVGRELADGVIAIVGTVDSLIRPDEDTVRPCEQPFSPRGQPCAVAVKDQHRMGTAVEDVDAVPPVGGHGGDFRPAPAIGQFGPRIIRFIAKDTAVFVWHGGLGCRVTHEHFPLFALAATWLSRPAIPATATRYPQRQGT